MSKTKNLFNREVWVELKPDTIQDGREYVTTSSGDSYMGSVKYRSVPRRIKTTLKNALQITGAFALTSIVLGGDKVSADSTNVPLNPKNIIIEERFFYPQPKDSAKVDSSISAKKISGKDSTERNFISSYDPRISAAGNGIFDAAKVFLTPLYPSTKMSGDSLAHALKGGEIKDYHFIDGEKGIQNALTFIKNHPEIYNPQSGLVKGIINDFKGLAKLAKESPSDSLSLFLLNQSMKNDTLDVKGDSLYVDGNWRMKDGIYILAGKSKKIKDGKLYMPESKFSILEIKTCAKNQIIPFHGLAGVFTGHNANDTTGQGRTAVVFYPTLQISQDSIPPQPEPSLSGKMGIIAGVHAGQNGVKGVEAGVQYGQVAFVAGYDFTAVDENLERKYGQVSSTGMQSVRSLDNVNFSSAGLAVEYGIKDFIAGIGATRWSWDKQRSIGTQDIRTQQAIETPKYDTPEKNSKWSADFKLGYGRKISKNLRLEGITKYNTSKGVSAGARINYNFRQ